MIKESCHVRMRDVSDNRNEPRKAIAVKKIMSIVFGGSLLFSAIAQGQSIAQSLRTEDLVGRWGVAAYWNDADATKITAQAKGFCSQPYIISKGKNGGAVMFEAFDGKPKEVVVQSGQIVSADGAGRNTTKTIQSWNGSTLVVNYVDEEAKRRYGNMVFVRCGR
jgi:hypothetical protein